MSDDLIEQAMTTGITFKGGAKEKKNAPVGVKSKAKKKAYITGSHGSAAAKKKADIRTKKSNRGK